MFVNISIYIIYEKYVFSAVSYNSKNYNCRKYYFYEYNVRCGRERASLLVLQFTLKSIPVKCGNEKYISPEHCR